MADYKENTLSVVTGAWGWRHKSWEQGYYYPDDLPEEWQLSYYSNDYDCVVVPAAYWQGGADEYDPESWLDDVDDDFVFFVDWPLSAMKSVADMEQCARRISVLGGQLGGVLINQQLWMRCSQEEQKALQMSCEAFEHIFYHPDFLQSSSEKIVLIESGKGENLRDLGQRLGEQLKGGHTEYLVLGGADPTIERLQEITTLLDVMGM